MNNESYYGGIRPNAMPDAIARYQEELDVLGYTVIEDALDTAQLEAWRQRIDAVYAVQEAEFGGREALTAIGEQDLCRAPLIYDEAFVQLASTPAVLELMRRVLGDWYILNLQNAIINRPDERHHQTAWHRDLPYQNWTSSRPLALGALFAIDPFTTETGGTIVLPHSHRHDTMPSENYLLQHAKQITASAGSVLIFDAMVFHRAGVNRSSKIRRGVNHLYTIPLLKQQYDFPAVLGEGFSEDPVIRRLLGYDSRVPKNALEWRRARANRLGATQREQ